ncbi:MAG: ABC transporter substrate-binding protein [Thermoproteota archaeon]|nr:ABC transporter substrate-binding protein [Thermoproteota archaeon]MDQ5859589.1 ABC transporter substrate-binding protein [Thermoproteota archaeon]
MDITVGHTPDADDAFMFYALASGKLGSIFVIKNVIQDIEALNRRALKHELDVTAVSAHAYAYLKDYIILKSGGSFGLNYGPIVITRKENMMSPAQLENATIAIPGKLTSANLLLKLAVGKFKEKVVPFETVPDAVARGNADAGLVIHEAQIAYDNTKFASVMDLGHWWSKNTGNLPVPLGINVASTRTMSIAQIKQFSDLFTKSIKYGLDNIDDALEYAMQFGRGQSKATIRKFVEMYVNNLTLDMGHEGKKALEEMFEMAKDRKMLELDIQIEVV